MISCFSKNQRNLVTMLVYRLPVSSNMGEICFVKSKEVLMNNYQKGYKMNLEICMVHMRLYTTQTSLVDS